MRKILFILALSIAANFSFAQSKLSVDSASKHIGEKVTICSKVYGVKSLEKLSFINLGAAYPNSPLTLVIYAKDLVNFKDTPQALYHDKNICVTGTITEFKGKPQIVVSKPEDIVVE